MADAKELAAQAVDAVRRYVAEAFSKAEQRLTTLSENLEALVGRVKDLEERQAPEPSEPPTHLTPDEIRQLWYDLHAREFAGWQNEFMAKAHEALARLVEQRPAPRDGRDALEIEVLPSIDRAKSYPRGTFATHHGGLVRALRRTDPLQEDDLSTAGWQVLVDGVREISVEPRGERAFAISVARTSGAAKVVEARMNVVLDRGVFREAHAYEHGDGVTFGGSYWIAQKDAPEGKPGTSPDWRLAVKKGRDGADARAER
jgi:hypothetical protein